MPEPGNLKQVVVSDKTTNPTDEIATLNLLQSCLNEDTYKCPRCDYSTKDVDDMIEHLAEEINKSVQIVSELPPRQRKKQ